MKTVFLVAALVVTAAATQPADDDSLSGAKVVKVVPRNGHQLRHLRKLLHGGKYDFWKDPSSVGKEAHIMATTALLPELLASLERHGLEATVGTDDVGQVVRSQMSGIYQRGFAFMDWTDYHDYDTINRWMEFLTAEHPDLCTLETVGKSYEGRAMKLLTVGKGGDDKPGIFMDGGIHAREWISPATVTYMVNELVTKSTVYDDLLSNVNFYVMPVINPDGYAYTFTCPRCRMWRKTRSDNASPLGCKGVDPNRNWDFHWKEIGASNESCADTYAGRKPFSEVELRVVRDVILRLADNIKVYLTFHSFGQKWLYPWGYTSGLPDDSKDLDNLARAAVGALTAVHGTKFEVGSSTNVIYAAAGGSDDWCKGVVGIKYAYTVELRDEGRTHFLLPKTQIIPSGEETLQALLVIANFTKNAFISK